MPRSIVQNAAIYDPVIVTGLNFGTAVQTTAMTANYTMANDQPVMLALNPSTTARNVVLPPISGNTGNQTMEGRTHFIFNQGTANLTAIAAAADGSGTVAVIPGGQLAIVMVINSLWGSAIVAGPSSGASAGANFRNAIDGGDATINPWQRGTSFTGVATNIYTADRWNLLTSATESAIVAKTADTTVPGFSQSFAIGRTQSSGVTGLITFNQALESADSIRFQGQTINFSFFARGTTGWFTGMSAGTAGVANINVVVDQGFGTDQGVSAQINGTWTTQSQAISSIAALTQTMQRFSFSGTVSTTATQLGVRVSYTPVGQTATTSEQILVNGFQLEMGGLTPFEHRDVEVELALCQRYAFVINEPGTSGTQLGLGMVGGTNSALFTIALPTPMRIAPSVTVTQGSFGCLNSSGAYTALTSMGAGTFPNTTNAFSITGAATLISGFATTLVSSSATTGKIVVSADM